MKREIKIPTIFAILLIIVVLGGVTVFTNYYLRVGTNAKANVLPQHLAVTTVTDSGFVVSWETDTPTFSAAVITDPSGQKQTFFDERHIIGDSKKFTVAHIPIRGLTPNTDYKLELLIDGKPYSSADLASVHTGPTLESDSNGLQPVYGSVVTPENVPADGALVFLTVGENSQILSTLVKPSGSWIVPLNLLRTKDLSALITKTQDREQISITIRYNGQDTPVMTDTLNSSPVPPVTIGNNYDFRGQQAKKKSEPSSEELSSSFSSVLGSETAQATSSSGNNEHTVMFISPSDGGHIPSDSPLIAGRGIPGNIVTLLIGITNAYTQTTKISPDGSWRYTPEKPIGIGPQRITMTTLDSANKPIAITHAFEIMKSGTQVLGDATPSGTIATTPTRTPTPTTVSASPSATLTLTPSPTAVIPQTATIAPTNMLLLIGLGLILTGLIVVAI